MSSRAGDRVRDHAEHDQRAAGQLQDLAAGLGPGRADGQLPDHQLRDQHADRLGQHAGQHPGERRPELRRLASARPRR